MFQIQINTKDGWSVASSVAGYKAEFLSLEEAQLKFARCANDNDIPSMYRILDLDTLTVYTVYSKLADRRKPGQWDRRAETGDEIRWPNHTQRFRPERRKDAEKRETINRGSRAVMHYQEAK